MDRVIDVKNAVCGYPSKPVIDTISFSVASGEILCIIGPNGVGKTTLLKTLLGLLPLQKGNIDLCGQPLGAWSRSEFAKLAGYIPQAHIPPFPYKVIDVVLMGRTAYLGAFSSPSKQDESIAQEALAHLGIFHLRNRLYTEISGGERQLVLIARTLSQQPKLLVMDEPTANLDFGNQIRVLEKITSLSRKQLAVVMTTHFPAQAFLCASKVLLLTKDGYQLGTADEIITEHNLYQAFGVQVKIVEGFDENQNKFKTCIPMLHTEKMSD